MFGNWGTTGAWCSAVDNRAKRLDGSTSKTNFFIFHAIQTDLVQYSPLEWRSEKRRVFHCHMVAFFQLHFWEDAIAVCSGQGQKFTSMRLFFASTAVSAADYSHSDRVAKPAYCDSKFVTLSICCLAEHCCIQNGWNKSQHVTFQTVSLSSSNSLLLSVNAVPSLLFGTNEK